MTLLPFRLKKVGGTPFCPFVGCAAPLAALPTVQTTDTSSCREQCATMPSRNIIPKQGNAKALRAKRKREPQVHENVKTAIIIKGRKTSQDVTAALKDIVS